MKNFSILLIITFLISSCASLINSKYQKVSLIKDKGTEVSISGEKPKDVKIKKGSYYIRRDGEPKQVIISKEGYKTQYYALMQNKKSKIVYASWAIPAALTIFSPGAAVAALLIPSGDNGYRAFNYEKNYDFRGMVYLPEKSEKIKEIKLNNFSVDMEAEDFKVISSSSYRKFIKGKVSTYTAADEDEFSEGIKVENTIFSEVLNELLVDKGYIDTTRRFFKDNYMENLLIDASLSECTINMPHVLQYRYSSGGAVSAEISIEWKALDYYKTPVYTKKSKVSSGEFAFYNFESRKESVKFAIRDAIENSFYQFMNDKKVQKLLRDKSQQQREESLEELIITKSNKHVSNLSEAVSSSVTIKTKNGHGSGFFISENGYLITNYHVVSDNNHLTVILNDESKHQAKIVRYSKIHDIALLKIEANELTPFIINASKEIELATEVFAVGTPTIEDLSQTISKGIISGVRKTGKDTKLIQTDASINAGNSGGAIVNKDGLVLGIVSSKLSGFGIEGVAFGIPAYEIFDKLKITFKEGVQGGNSSSVGNEE